MPPKRRRSLKRPATMPTNSLDSQSRRSPRRSAIRATTATRDGSTSLLAQTEDDMSQGSQLLPVHVLSPGPSTTAGPSTTTTPPVLTMLPELGPSQVSTSSPATVQVRANFGMAESFAEISRSGLNSLAYTSGLQGGAIPFIIITDNIEVTRVLGEVLGNGALHIGVTALGVLFGYRLVRPLIEDAVREAIGCNRNDQLIQIRPGSLHVLLHCFTDERFREVRKDYESGRIKERLQKELSQIGIEVVGLRVEIENTGRSSPTEKAGKEEKISPRIIVQGGVDRLKSAATKVKEIVEEDYMDATKESAKKGYAILMNKGTAVDAVEAAVRVLENNENFNAGRGSNLNCHGEVECDAMIMEGHTLKNGAVISGRHFRNPVSLCKKIMYDSAHCALSGDGARQFAKKINFPICDPEELVGTDIFSIDHEHFAPYIESQYGEDQSQKQQKQHDTNDTGSAVAIKQHTSDTVSAVAMDTYGHLACATSSGGIAAKLKGRVSDASLIGCGGYANKMGGATVTGVGESIMKMTLAREVVYSMEHKKNAQDSAKDALEKLKELANDPELKSLVNGCEVTAHANGGVIAIDKNGNFGMAFTTPVMFWASIKDNTLQFGSEPNEHKEEQITI